MNMSFYQFKKPHCGDETIITPSHLEYGISYTGKTSLYQSGPKKIMDKIDQYKTTTNIIRGLTALQWRYNERDGVSTHQSRDCLLNRLFRRRSKKTSKPSATGRCAVNSPVSGEFPEQRASNAENVSIWWRHHDAKNSTYCIHSCSDILTEHNGISQ